MAGDWIKMTKDLAQKPETRRLARILKISRYDAVGRLHAVWSWADTHSLAGSDMDITEEDIDDISELDGFADALRQVGWLKGRAAALEFPHFDRHNGQTAKRRAQESLRVSKMRTESGHNAYKCTHLMRTESEPEKRREEKNISSIVKETGTLPFAESSNYDRPQTIAEVEQFMSGLISRPLGEELSKCAAKFFTEYKQTKSWKKAAKSYAEVWAANNRSKDPDWKTSHRPKDANSGRSYK